MTIGVVYIKNNRIYIRDESGKRIADIPLPKGFTCIIGYTSSTFAVEVGSRIYIYDERGKKLADFAK